MTGRGTSYEGTPPPSSTGGGERRVALVVGNSSYHPSVGQLRNPRNDAEKIAARLSEPKFGFTVTLQHDLTRRQMIAELDALAQAAEGANVVVYYAGHGAAAVGTNVLLPVDFDFEAGMSKNLLAQEVLARGVSLDHILAATSKALRVIIFLDACRNDAARRVGDAAPSEVRSFLTGGFTDAKVKSHWPQRLVAYSTNYGQPAADGDGNHSPYTKALLELIEEDEPVGSLLNRLRGRVYSDTAERQFPTEDNGLTADFRFVLAQHKKPPEPAPLSSPDPGALFELAALHHWEALKGTSDSAQLRDFIAEYGSSRMGKLAREALQKLATTAWRKVSKRDEAALVKFIADYDGTREVVEANALLLKTKSSREAPTAITAANAVSKSGSGKNLLLPALGGVVALAALGVAFAIWQPWRHTSPAEDHSTQATAQAKSDDEAFSAAEKRGALDGYGEYLGRFPQGRHAKLAQERIAWLRKLEADFASLSASGTRAELEAFARTNPAFKPRIDAALVARETAETDRCGGIRTEVAGKGIVCLDPKKPDQREFQDCKDGFCGPVLVALPKGTFRRGSDVGDDDEKPVRDITIDYHLAVGKFEVTFAEWDACVKAGGCRHEPRDLGWGRMTRPVMNVSWNDAWHQYVRWLQSKSGMNYRLLTEAEWEYAAQAATSGKDQISETELKGKANFSNNQTIQVGQFPANGFGLHDMLGNVWEWVVDRWRPDYSKAPADGSAWTALDGADRRVRRGGSWDNAPDLLRIANRGFDVPDERSPSIGFRVARTLPPAP